MLVWRTLPTAFLDDFYSKKFRLYALVRLNYSKDDYNLKIKFKDIVESQFDAIYRPCGLNLFIHPKPL